ncbi:MAG: hypothetical protein V2B14_06360 [bacterium]
MNELKGPSVFEIKQFIKDKIWIEFHIIDNKTFKGQIIWFDDDAFHIILENSQKITLLKNSIIYYHQSG